MDVLWRHWFRGSSHFSSALRPRTKCCTELVLPKWTIEKGKCGKSSLPCHSAALKYTYRLHTLIELKTQWSGSIDIEMYLMSSNRNINSTFSISRYITMGNYLFTTWNARFHSQTNGDMSWNETTSQSSKHREKHIAHIARPHAHATPHAPPQRDKRYMTFTPKYVSIFTIARIKVICLLWNWLLSACDSIKRKIRNENC